MTISWFDHCIRQLAARQHGVFTGAQARELGATEAIVKHRLRRGDWEVVGDGVYRRAGSLPSWHQRLQIALLVAGPAAAVSHLAAAALWGLPGFGEGSVEILVAHGRGNYRMRSGRVRESRFLPDHHVKVVAGLRVTSMERTLFDLAGVVHPGRAERAIDNALVRDLTKIDRLWTAWSELAARGRRGTRAMRGILQERQPGYVAPESVLEEGFMALCKAVGIEGLERQVNLGGDDWVGRVDFLARWCGVLVEVDGRVGHGSHLDRERDRIRDAEMAAIGMRVLRLNWTDVVSRPTWTVRILRETFAAGALRSIPA